MPTLLYIPRFDESGAAPRYRVYQYFASLKAQGFTITAKPLLDIRYLHNLYFNKKRSYFHIFKCYLKRAIFLLFNKSKFDLVLMDGELFPFLPYFVEKWFLPKHFIIDQDDAIFHTYDVHKSWLVRFLLADKIKQVWHKSQHVIVGNEYTKSKAYDMGLTRVTALPTVVNADVYKPTAQSRHAFRDCIVIGWVGSPTTIQSMTHIEPALIKVASKANIVLYVIGADYQLPGVNVICQNWQQGWSEAEEIKFTNEIDIGIMPLLDKPYERGKGGFKLIKYMACAKPIMASPVSINVEIVEHGVNGYLASTCDEWERYLLMLIENAEKRKEFGLAGREKMLKNYSLQAMAPKFCHILSEAC